MADVKAIRDRYGFICLMKSRKLPACGLPICNNSSAVVSIQPVINSPGWRDRSVCKIQQRCMLMDVHDEESGEKVIRAALWARRSRLATIARDTAQVAPETLHAFVSGARLAPEVLQKLTVRIWGGALRYDHLTDRLQSANTVKPTSIGVGPPPVAAKPRWKAGLSPSYGHGGGAPVTVKKPRWLKW